MTTKIEELLQELEQEGPATRKVLERVPEDKLGWKPHERSFSLGQLALHVATLPGAVAQMSRQSPFPVPKFVQAAPATAAELLPGLEASLATARETLRGMTDADLGGTWRLLDGEHEIMALPVGAVLRTIMLNHWYHHRGQLCVYLRQVGALVPSVYGPSADESPFVPRPSPISPHHPGRHTPPGRRDTWAAPR
jgi:uncharacterized damage-inducible protein DinB